jgi:hypothetical protein
MTISGNVLLRPIPGGGAPSRSRGGMRAYRRFTAIACNEPRSAANFLHLRQSIEAATCGWSELRLAPGGVIDQ